MLLNPKEDFIYQDKKSRYGTLRDMLHAGEYVRLVQYLLYRYLSHIKINEEYVTKNLFTVFLHI
jgi:hypothetical protein